MPLGSAMGPRCACRGEAGGKCENKNFADRRPKKQFSQKKDCSLILGITEGEAKAAGSLQAEMHS